MKNTENRKKENTREGSQGKKETNCDKGGIVRIQQRLELEGTWALVKGVRG